MLVLILLLLFQDDTAFTPEAINAQVFVEGNRLDLVDVRIKGVQPYTFEFQTEDGSSLVNLFQIARIVKNPDTRKFKVVFTSGEEIVGRIRSLSFTGNPDHETGKRQTYLLANLERIYFLQGNQLRSCAQGHYEKYTPYPFCPMCGNPLQLGAYEEQQQGERAVWPTHTLRIDGRDPSSTATRRY